MFAHEGLGSSTGWGPAAANKVCYLCHSLLTLAGVVVSSQDITADQWGELQLLCMQLDRHISTHIRESPQAMHRTKLKDLATQTYIRWQDLLAHCQPQVVSHNPLDLGGMGSGCGLVLKFRKSLRKRKLELRPYPDPLASGGSIVCHKEEVK
ncbi:hypothetical protein A6R68_13037 [Neotoma lepida]|uniref:Protein FAM178B n=1 Tax=Neotoma lepida TaxID=56216 RepID=A0A1A6H3J6_NEOLE|nr:hypothetical protein A6R68_13037 [Neotoma lepida]